MPQATPNQKWQIVLGWAAEYAENHPSDALTESLGILEIEGYSNLLDETYWRDVVVRLEKLNPEDSVKRLEAEGFDLVNPERNRDQRRLFQKVAYLTARPDA